MSCGIGILGAGVMGSDHARILGAQIAGAHLVGIFDPDPARAEAAAAANGARRAFGEGIALIDDPEVDAVLVASPDETHADFVLACLARGKPVLCEKPLAASAEECLTLVEAETSLGKRLIQVGSASIHSTTICAEPSAVARLGRPCSPIALIAWPKCRSISRPTCRSPTPQCMSSTSCAG